MRELPPSVGLPSLVLVRKTPKAALKEKPSLRNTLQPTVQKSPGLMCTPTALLKIQFRRRGRCLHLVPGGREDKISLAASLYSTNYKAEAEPLKTAAGHIEVSTHASHSVVLLMDALSTLQAIQSNRDTDQNDLSTALASLSRSHAVTLQWIPSHCNMPGNEAADSLAKEGTTKEQVDRSTSYPEVKIILKTKRHY